MSAFQELDEQQINSGGVPVDASPQPPSTYRFCRPAILHFGDAGAEYAAAKNHAVIFDVGDRTRIELRGPDAKSFLQGFCTNDILKLNSGEGCEAFITNVKGRVLAHVFVFVDDELVTVETSPGLGGLLAEHLDRYIIRERVEVIDRTGDLGGLLVVGPESASVLTGAADDHAAPDVWCRAAFAIGGVAPVTQRVDAFGSPGYWISANAGELPAVWKHLVDAGARPAGAEAFHAIRIEAAFPLSGLDVTDANFLQEVDRDAAAISFTKGCYLGQEPIARIDAVGHVNRKLRRVQFDAPHVPEVGAAIQSDGGDSIGAVTSSARVPGADSAIALAMLKTSHVAAGARVVVAMDGDSVIGMVV